MTTRKETGLEPGRTIDYLRGEILTIQLTQWGIIGKVRTKDGIFNYRLKDPELKKKLILGMDLVIENGFCITNKEEEIVATEGKFGKADTDINLSRYYLDDETNSIVTGRIKTQTQTEEGLEVIVERLLPPFNREIILIKEEEKEKIKLVNKDQIKNSIIKIEGFRSNSKILCKKIDILPKNHFWYKIMQMTKIYPEEAVEFSHIILEQMESIANHYEMFKDLLFNMGKEVSKNTLLKLRDVIESKVLEGEMKFPFNILISKAEVIKYLDSMLNFCRNMIHGAKVFKEPDDLVILIEHYYPNYKTEY